jgi:hypothetical protein
MTTLTFHQKWCTRNTSLLEYIREARKDRRQAIYRLLPLITNPNVRRTIAMALARFKPQTPGLGLDEQAMLQLKKLQQNGIVTDMPSIDQQSLQDIQQYFLAQPCHDPWRPHLGQFQWNEVPSDECNMGMYTADQIVRAPHVMKLFNHPALLQLAQAYMGCKPTLDNIGCWWSYGGRTLAKGTQKFHRDFDSLGGFKVFFYLTDVGPEQGPHEYIEASHQNQTLDTGAGIPDPVLWEHYPPSSKLVVTGNAGTSFIADTFGIHRGQLPTSGQRLLLSAQYNVNVSPHSPRQPLTTVTEAGLDAYVNRLYMKTSHA